MVSCVVDEYRSRAVELCVIYSSNKCQAPSESVTGWIRPSSRKIARSYSPSDMWTGVNFVDALKKKREAMACNAFSLRTLTNYGSTTNISMGIKLSCKHEQSRPRTMLLNVTLMILMLAARVHDPAASSL